MRICMKLMKLNCFLLFTIIQVNILLSQELQVSGKVSNKDGPMEGVNIFLEKQPNKGTFSDKNGDYKITAPMGSTLVFSYMGMGSKKIVVKDNKLDVLFLASEYDYMDELVVVGYTEKKKGDITGAMTTVEVDEISTPSANFSNSMEGMVSGVELIRNSGFTGASSSIKFRGNLREPIYVIDGIVSDKVDFDALDNNEIKSINFLKDLASASVYGNRAANGVILVKTITGGKPKVKYSFSYSSDYTTTRDMQDWTGIEEAEYTNDVILTASIRDSVNGSFDADGKLKPKDQRPKRNYVPRYDAEEMEYARKLNYKSINDYIWQNPSQMKHNISITGGTDKLKYYLGAGMNNDNGAYHNTDYSKNSFRSNVTYEVNKTFEITAKINGFKRKMNRFYWPYDGGGFGNFTLSDFYRSIFKNSRLVPLYVDENGDASSARTKFPVVGTFILNWHPVELVKNGGYLHRTNTRANSTLMTNINIPGIENLKGSIMFNYMVNYDDSKDFIKHNEFYKFQSDRDGNELKPLKVDPNNPLHKSLHLLNSSYSGLRHGSSSFDRYQFNYQLNYENTFGAHKISLLGVFENVFSSSRSQSSGNEDLLSTSVDQVFATSGDRNRNWFGGSESENAREAYIGRVGYSYDGKYIFDFILRYDGSYIFAPDKRWGTFPGVSLAWNISKENFFQSDLVKNLKLRLSYGSAGDDGNIRAFQWQKTYQNGSGYIFGSSTLSKGIRQSNPPNTNITWEKANNINLGLSYDIKIDDGILIGDLDYFYTRRYDILVRRIMSIPRTYGAGQNNENYEQTQVQGFDMSLKYKNTIQSIGLEYEVGGNFSIFSDKVLVRDEPASYKEDKWKYKSVIGKTNHRLWGYRSAGIIRDQKKVDELNEKGFTQWGRKILIGTILYKDIRGPDGKVGPDGKIDGNDQEWLSDNSVPRISYGINTTFKWKNIKLFVLFQGVASYDRMIRTLNTMSGGVFQTGGVPYFGLWTQRYTDKNPNAPYPRATTWGKGENGYVPSDFWMRDGAFLRLKRLNLSYSLPKEFINSIGFENLHIFVEATNLFDISSFKEKEIDPQQHALDSFPMFKTFTIGVSVSLLTL